jgi:hypothetical protein
MFNAVGAATECRMPQKRYLPSPDIVPLDQRCLHCRNPLDRVGRYCGRCVRGQRLKLIFGSLAVVQIAVAGALTLARPKGPAMIASEVMNVTPVKVSAPGSGWTYYDVSDPLIDDITHHAKLAAKIAPRTDGAPPNPAAAGGVLEVSSSRHYGTNVVLRFAAAPRTCPSIPCTVTAIFDQNPPRQIPYRDVSDESGTVLMLTADQDFVDDLLSAHDLTVTADLGPGHTVVLTFNVAGFNMRMAALAARIRTAVMWLGVVGPG